MTKPAAFQATVHGFRTVPSRGVVSLTIEAPIEQHAEIARIAEHGAWVAVARIQQPKESSSPVAVASQNNAEGSPSSDAANAGDERPSAGKKSWRDLPPSQQAAIRCNEPIFIAFLKEHHADVLMLADDNAAQAVRDLCCVPSRSELNTNHQARILWTQLENQFQAWKTVDA